MTEKEAFEESLVSRYFKSIETKDRDGFGTLYEKLLSLVSIWSTRYWDIILVEPKSSKVQKMYNAFEVAEKATEELSRRKISTFIYYNAIYFLARFFGKE